MDACLPDRNSAFGFSAETHRSNRELPANIGSTIRVIPCYMVSRLFNFSGDLMLPDNTAPLGLALLGLVLGMRHATDPDHVVAVTAILSNERRLGAATRIGLVWGLGHTTTVLAVGAAIILFKLSIPARLGLAMEFVVALVLILLGLSAASNLMKHLFARLGLIRLDTARALIVHSHPHSHAGNVHRHAHVHPRAHDTASAPGHSSGALHSDHRLPKAIIPDVALPGVALRRRLLKSFVVGLAHGLAGSAAIALLILSAIPEPLWATVYLAIFCIGTILGMMLITTAIGAPFVLAYSRMASVHRALALGSGLLSFGFGLFLAYQIAVVDRFFSVVPLWTPH